MIASAIFLCAVLSVTDGDTVRCVDGTRVRLAAIDAAELGSGGEPAREALGRLASGRTLRCQHRGWSYRRRVAYCSANGRDLSCAMVRQGYAVRLERYDRRRELCRNQQ